MKVEKHQISFNLWVFFNWSMHSIHGLMYQNLMRCPHIHMMRERKVTIRLQA